MTVKQLIEYLQSVDNKERIVIMQKDAEGNGYSPLEGVDYNAVYIEQNSWSGEVMLEKLTPELRKQGLTKSDVGEGIPCLVLYPVN